MKSFPLIAAWAALVIPASTLAQTAGPSPAAQGSPPAETQASVPAPTARNAAKPLRICKAAELTGSRVAKGRVCKTREQWDTIARKSREGTEEFVRQALDGQSSTLVGN